MAAWILKNPLACALAALCICLAAALAVQTGYWHLIGADAKFRAGQADATAKISQNLAEAQRQQVEITLVKERAQADALAAQQAEIEKERQDAQTIITNLRSELGRLQQYAKNQSSRRNLPTPAESAAAPDEAVAKGWALFGKCASEYAAMAEVADSQRNDLAEWQAYGRIVTGK